MAGGPNAFFWRRWQRAEEAGGGDPRARLEAVLDMVAATASHPNWRGCPFLNTGTEFPEPDHPARAVILAHKRAVGERLQTLAAAAGARAPELLAQQLQLLIDGAYAIGQSLGPDGPAATVAGAGRALIAVQVAAQADDAATASHRPPGPAFGRPEDGLRPVPMADMGPGLRRENEEG